MEKHIIHHFADTLEKEDNFIKLYKFTCQLTPIQSYMLSYLIDAERFSTLRWPEDEHYFMCCKKGFVDKLLTGWPTNTIKRAFAELRDLKLIDYFDRHLPHSTLNHTWVKLNEIELGKLKISWEQYLKEDFSRELKEDFRQDLKQSNGLELNEPYYNQELVYKDLEHKDVVHKDLVNKDSDSSNHDSSNPLNNQTSSNPQDIFYGENNSIDIAAGPAPTVKLSVLDSLVSNRYPGISYTTKKSILSLLRDNNLSEEKAGRLINDYASCAELYAVLSYMNEK